MGNYFFKWFGGLNLFNNYLINILNIIEVHVVQDPAKIGFQARQIASFPGKHRKRNRRFELIPHQRDLIALKPKPTVQLPLSFPRPGGEGHPRLQLPVPFPEEEPHQAQQKKE